MKVTLLSHTPEPEKLVAAAAKLCYSDEADIGTLMDSLDDPAAVQKFIRKLMESNHESPLEHVSFTFGIEGVSRSLLAQITRHRLASFSVRSQRYCKEDGVSPVIPDAIFRNDSQSILLMDAVSSAFDSYDKLLVLGAKKEDARAVLPNACPTRMIVTMNARELLHFFSLRCCTRAQGEIRMVANQMLAFCKDFAPTIFEHSGAACDRLGYCPEGKMSCGRKPTLNDLFEKYAESTVSIGMADENVIPSGLKVAGETPFEKISKKKAARKEKKEGKG